MHVPGGVGVDRDYDEPARAPVSPPFAANTDAPAPHSTIASRNVPRPFVFVSAAPSPNSGYIVAASDMNSPLQLLFDALFISAFNLMAILCYHAIAFGGAKMPGIDFSTCLLAAMLFPLLSRALAQENGALVERSYDRLRNAAFLWTLAFGVLTFAFFALKVGAEASRGAVISLYFVGLPAIALWRVFSPLVVAPLAIRLGAARRECIIAGDESDSRIDKLAVELQARGHPAPTVVKFRAHCLAGQWGLELDRLVASITAAAHHQGPGEIYVCAGSAPGDRLAAINRRLRLLPRAIYVVPDTQTASLVRCKPSRVGSYVALEVRREPLRLFQRCIKRMMDVVFSGVALAFLSPFLLLTAIAIRLDTKGPILFRQTRNGYRGQPFKILKFRSMTVQEDGAHVRQASRGDARVTRVGRILRQYSIDELPQLVNIFLGDMSLVGPRPHAQAHDAFYAQSIENYEIRQHVKPGLTGWAQVNGLRGETATIDAMDRRIEFDLWYAVNASILLDIEIIVRTAIEVVRHRNAY